MMRRMYIHERDDWPSLRWDDRRLHDILGAARFRQGRLVGRMESLGFEVRRDAELTTLSDDVLKSSEIEGEFLDREQVRSSIARRLGMHVGGLQPVDRSVDGIVDVTLDATAGYDLPLTSDRLFDWHAALFPTGRSGMRRITVGWWRDDRAGPMQVVSGPIGRERVHFEAPAAERLDAEMRSFLDWFNSSNETDGALKAGLAHLWFVTIHPFDDGNGRIARAITDMAFAKSEESSQRFYSMSSQISRERAEYYRALESAQRGTTDVTDWLLWFLGCLGRAIEGAETNLARTLARARFWDGMAGSSINERQRMMLNRLLGDFRGKLTTSKWAQIAKCSQDTALRDINELVSLGALKRSAAGGRSTSYELVEDHYPAG